MKMVFLPTEHTQNQIKHEEGANKDECGEEDPWPFHSYSIVYLYKHILLSLLYIILIKC